ncbi:MAG: tRNA (adenosine(37)-N6)-threonylcarbamoyltransferase complex transferase subunit TsaD [Nitrospiraceae bacterium]|nr:MAG: tRNA (adenosine(37)-N6)-threonylcarbamoyltransferase complex transferase subunit TsaD [Nitrospiraceae bacterium]
MLILGIDTSCDDTAASVVEDGSRIISNVVSSQNEIHKKHGGIVPELASRRHLEMILPVVDEALARTGMQLGDISAIAVTRGPGLIGSLLVGVCFAKALSFIHRIPLVSVNHIEGHIFSIFLESGPEFPFLALVVSGGHTSIYRIDGFREYVEIGRTRDDAAGEAYDKVAKLLGFGYPGGPVIDALAADGNPGAIAFPRKVIQGSFDFSFSGLKTSVLTHLKKYPHSKKEDVAASFQSAVVEILSKRLMEVAKAEGIKRIVLSGGVSANSSLRSYVKQKALDEGIEVYLPSLNLCTDNAAMIAAAGYVHFINGDMADFTLNPQAYMPLGGSAHG